MTTDVIPPPPSREPTGPFATQSGAHPAPPRPWWVGMAASVGAALIVAAVGALVTWGNVQARVDAAEVQVERLETQIDADRARASTAIQRLELQQTRTEVQLSNAVQRLGETTTRLESAVERIEERLPPRRRR